jgi:outer membrane protein OmpA-like peptidoglycan-associated protein
MRIFVKIYTGELIEVFNTSTDLKKSISLTTVADLQKDAEAEFFAESSKLKTIIFRNLPPARAHILSLDVLIELLDNDILQISYKDKDDRTRNDTISLAGTAGSASAKNNGKKDKKDIAIISSVIFVILCMILFIIFGTMYSKKDGMTVTQDVTDDVKAETLVIEQKPEKEKEIVLERTDDVKIELISNARIDVYNGTYIKEHNNIQVKESLETVIKENTPLYFVQDSTELLDNDKMKLEKIINALINYSEVELVINGYTDSVNKPDNEKYLSELRAKYIKEKINNRCQGKQVILTVKGWGAANRIFEGNDIGKKYLNRRADIEVLKAK